MKKKLITLTIAALLVAGMVLTCLPASAAEVVEDIPTIQSFTSDPVAEEDLIKIVTAGINAPSAINQQPWHFSVVTDPAVLEEIAGGGDSSGDSADSEAAEGESAEEAAPAEDAAAAEGESADSEGESAEEAAPAEDAAAAEGESADSEGESAEDAAPAEDAAAPAEDAAAAEGESADSEGESAEDAAPAEDAAAPAEDAAAEGESADSEAAEGESAEDAAPAEDAAAEGESAEGESAEGESSGDAAATSANASVGDSPVAIVISCSAEATGTDPAFDAGLACMSMAIEAELLGYGTKIVSSPTMVLNGTRQDEFREMLGIPADMSVVAVLLIGVPAQDEADIVSSASTRNSMDEVVTFVAP